MLEFALSPHVAAPILAGVLDLISTLVLFNLGGIEANPLMSYLLHQGASAFIIVKFGLTLLVAKMLYFTIQKPESRLSGLLMLGFTTGFWGFCALNNFYLLWVLLG